MTETVDQKSLHIIKKYPNRRLYDTQTSAYVTLSSVKELIMENIPIKVIDAKTEEDITRSILLQIILEEESGGLPMFSAESLAQIIRFYGHAMQGVMGDFLEQNIKAFIDIQERFSEQSKGMYGNQMGADAWAQFMSGQAPMLQNMLSNYIDQSKNLFVQMQGQLNDQTKNMWSNFPFPPTNNPHDK